MTTEQKTLFLTCIPVIYILDPCECNLLEISLFVAADGKSVKRFFLPVRIAHAQTFLSLLTNVSKTSVPLKICTLNVIKCNFAGLFWTRC